MGFHEDDDEDLIFGQPAKLDCGRERNAVMEGGATGECGTNV
ncbi:MAG: hypothetical protein AB9873_18960 [Syntrophobacteraceae bacterium]